MASMATPSRVGRGLLASCLDIKSPAIDDVATALSYGGLHTPPQSTHDSRRPSLQDSWCSTPAFEALSYSQPSTPVHQVHQPHDALMQSWSELGSTAANSTCSHLDARFVDSIIQDQSNQTSLVNPSLPGMHWEQYTSTPVFDLNFHPEPHNAWTPASDVGGSFATQVDWMGPMLETTNRRFRSAHVRPDPVYGSMTAFFPGEDRNFKIDQSHTFPHHDQASSSVFQTPSVVVPSQLAPLDSVGQSQASDYASPENSCESFCGESAAFNNIRLDSFDFIEPSSPIDMYTEQSDNEDYPLVQSEPTIMNSKIPQRSIRNSPIGLRKRASKRQRSQIQPWHSHERNGIEIRCTGTQFSLERPGHHKVCDSNKPHVCRYVLPNGRECGVRFKRPEHLKRHMDKHTTGPRPFPCPIVDCPLHDKARGIRRSDNACDHFKKHLEPHKSGKRTKPLDWQTLHDAIVANFDEKKAGRLIENLQRWIDAGMPKTAPRSKPGERRLSTLSPTVGPPITLSP